MRKGVLLTAALLASVAGFPMSAPAGAVTTSASPGGQGGVARADFDGDGVEDLAVGVRYEDVAAPGDNAGAVSVIYGSRRGLTSRGDQFWHQDRPGIEEQAEGDEWFGSALAAGDFDGDGRADLAIGAPFDDVGGVPGAGVVNVIYGSRRGLRARGDQLWHQDSPGIEDQAEAQDYFGRALAVGDFDGDGRADLAVGAVAEDVIAPSDNGGAVNIIYGSRRGLRARGDQLWHQDSPGIEDQVEQNDAFGQFMAAGNLGMGRQDDLAVGVWAEDVAAPDDDAGAVQVIYGSRGGLRARGDQLWHQDSPGIGDQAEPDDHLGVAVAVANFGKGPTGDLAIGASGEDLDGSDEGAVDVIFGRTGGLTARGDQFWHQDRPGIANPAENGDGFGNALTAANFGRGPEADLAVGSFESLDGSSEGAVNVIYGSPRGLTARGDQLWHQDRRGIADQAEDGDYFSFSVTAGDFGRSGQHELAVGVVGEGIGAAQSAGAVNVIYGRTRGLTARGDQFWHQDRPGIRDQAEDNDQFAVFGPVFD